MTLTWSLTPEDDRAHADATLAQWFTLKKRIAEECKPLVDQEMAMRKALFAWFFRAPTEGTNAFPLPDDFKLKATYPIDRKVDEGAMAGVKLARVGDMRDTLQALGLQSAQWPDDKLVLEAMLINLDTVLKWEPKLAVTAYKTLTAEQRAIVDMMLISKPGSISLEVAPPATKKAAPI